MAKCECPSCYFEFELDKDAIEGEIIVCPDCGVDLEIVIHGDPVGLVQIPVADPGIVYGQVTYFDSGPESGMLFIYSAAEEHPGIEGVFDTGMKKAHQVGAGSAVIFSPALDWNGDLDSTQEPSAGDLKTLIQGQSA